MKKIIAILALLFLSVAQAQTFPVQNLNVLGTSSFAGSSTFTARPTFNGNTPYDTGNLSFATPPAIGGTTPAAGSFSALSATGAVTIPTPAQFDSSQNAATTAFVKAAGLQYPTGGLNFSTTTTLTTSLLNGWGLFASNVTTTLPLLSSTQAGATFTFLGGTSGGTIKGNTSDLIVDSQLISANTLFVAPGKTYTLTANGTQWYVTSTGKSRTANACQSIVDYGGNPNGTTDNSAALTAAIAASPSNRPCVYFGPGKWAFTSSYTYTFPASSGSLMIIGAGTDVTEITFPNTSAGLNVTYVGAYDAIHIRDLSITSGTANASAVALNIVQSVTVANPALTALSDITNVTIRGADGYALTDYWSIGVELFKVSNFSLTNLEVIGSSGQLGIGTEIDGAAGNPPVEFNFQTDTYVNLTYGIILGTLVQGVSINQSNFTALNFGVYVPVADTGLDQLTISNSQFACGIGINVLAQFQNLMIIGNLFIVQNMAGQREISDNAAVLFTIIGNTFQNANAPSLGNNPEGIYLNNTAGTAGNVSGNVFRYMSPAIYLDTSATFVNVQSNAYFNNNTNISNNGSSNTLGGGSQ